MKTLSHFISKNMNYNAKLDTFVFDFDKDGHKDDIIKMQEPIYEIVGNGLVDVYHFAYIPEQASVDSKVYNKFLEYVKQQNIRKNIDVFNFVKFGIRKFVTDSRIKIYDVGVIVYPESRSNINTAIVHQIHKSTATTVQSFEIIKKLAKNIEFDFDKFKIEEPSMLSFKELTNYNSADKSVVIEHIKYLTNKNKQQDCFSIPNTSNAKYQPLFTNYLKFKSDKECLQFIELATKQILIIDDNLTTSSTIREICRMIRQMGINSKITIFTLIGNRYI